MPARQPVRDYWDADAATYDRSSGHWAHTDVERAAWRGTLAGLLAGASGQRILDVGAGTGFLTLLVCELGHELTAVDLSGQMLSLLQAKADAAGADVTVVESDANEVPSGPFDAVVSRHLLWLLPDPVAALRAWRSAAPTGRLVLIESLWGESADGAEKLRRSGRRALNRARRTPPAHHADFDDSLRAGLPLAHGPGPTELVGAVTAAGWPAPRLHRLAGVEWALQNQLGWPERLLGVVPRFAVVAGA